MRGIKPKDRLVKFDEVKDHTFYPFEREEERDQQPEEFEQEEILPKRVTILPAEPAEGEEAEPPVE